MVIGKYSATKSSASSISESELPENCFLPYGAIYYQEGGKYIYPSKNTDGSFTLNSAKTYTYTAFKKPGNVTTFSASRKKGNQFAVNSYDRGNAIQFASYGLNKTQNLGTLVFKGDIDAFCQAKGKTKTEMFETVATQIQADSKWYTSPFENPNNGNATENIYFARIPCTEHMWQSDASNGPIQFALRVYNIQDADLYTAVAYINDGGNYAFSESFLSKSFESVAVS